AAARDAELQAVGDARRHVHAHYLSLRYPPVTAALGARVGDLLAGPLALRAGPGRHHGPEDAPLHVLDLARSAAPPAPDRMRPRIGAGAGAAVAHDERLELHVLGRAERRLFEGE